MILRRKWDLYSIRNSRDHILGHVWATMKEKSLCKKICGGYLICFFSHVLQLPHLDLHNKTHVAFKTYDETFAKT